jgi:hypothetical protein
LGLPSPAPASLRLCVSARNSFPKSPLLCHPPPPHIRRGARIDRFSFFFAFYGLILGLAVAELLGGFAGIVRAHALKKLEPQIALAALLIFFLICATWIDAWMSLKDVTLDFAGLWAPVLVATCYYLAAATAFPREAEGFDALGSYFAQRKTFIVGMLLAAEFIEMYTYRSIYIKAYWQYPAIFWFWLAPYNLAIKASFIALFLVRSRRWNIILLTALVLLFLLPYWENGAIEHAISRHYGYAP